MMTFLPVLFLLLPGIEGFPDFRDKKTLVNGRLSFVNYEMSRVNGRLSFVNRRFTRVNGRPTFVKRQIVFLACPFFSIHLLSENKGQARIYNVATILQKTPGILYTSSSSWGYYIRFDGNIQ
jgi:hypothetical protein